jgi:hypothetical protein
MLNEIKTFIQSVIMLVSFKLSVAIKLIILSVIVLTVLGIIILSVSKLSVIYIECCNKGLF